MKLDIGRRTGVRFEVKHRDKLEGMSIQDARELIVQIAVPLIDRSWRATAKRRLSKRRAAIYVNAIQVAAFRKTSASLILTGAEANAIEFGADSWDMKPGLLKGKESRVIQFTHATYRAKGKFGQPMGSPYKRYHGEEAAHNIGRNVSALAAKMSVGEILRSSSAPFMRPHHTSPIYDRMEKFQNEERSGIAGTSYRTFRTVSINSPAHSWIYPRQEPAGLIDEAIEAATPHVQAAVDKILGGAIIQLKKGRSSK